MGLIFRNSLVLVGEIRSCKVATHQRQKSKITHGVDAAADEEISCHIDATTSQLLREIPGQRIPEVVNWNTLENRDQSTRYRQRYDEGKSVHEDAPELGNGEDAVLEQNSITLNSVCIGAESNTHHGKCLHGVLD